MTTSPRSGSTWAPLFIVLALLSILVGLFMPPFFWADHQGARRAICSSNQRQLVLAMTVYANDDGGKWPAFTCTADGRQVPALDPTCDQTATAIASLELLAARMGGDLSTKSFACPSHRSRCPSSAPDTGLGMTAWTSSWAANGPSAMGYAYDWATPTLASCVRVVTADRDQTAHRDRVLVAFADGHTGMIIPTQGSHLNRDASDDDIYDGYRDGPMLVPGEGSTTRAWVR